MCKKCASVECPAFVSGYGKRLSVSESQKTNRKVNIEEARVRHRRNWLKALCVLTLRVLSHLAEGD